MNEKYIHDFIEQVYPESVELALDVFNEKTCLEDATALIKDLKAENERLKKRDCNATIELYYDDGNHPFMRETLTIVDVGVSDNCYVVESQILNGLLEENEKLKADVKEWKQLANKHLEKKIKLQADNERLKEVLFCIREVAITCFEDSIVGIVNGTLPEEFKVSEERFKELLKGGE